MRLEAVMLPELGAGPDVAIIISHWFAARGTEVREGERLVEVRVGPATFDVPAPATGRLNRIRLREDDQARPGTVLGFVAVTEPDPEDRDRAVEDETAHDSDRRPGLPPSSRPS
jgi:pyruvate/2-oxoglutarate dehydrogenase complex dihydrolipoamide acyltransferase (E2) component